jgi:CheY-like chemotaxis protein
MISRHALHTYVKLKLTFRLMGMQQNSEKKSDFERRIRERMRQKNLSVSALARAANVSRVAIYNFLKGNYSRHMLNEVSRVLEIPPHVLLSPYVVSTFSDQDKVRQAYEASPPATRQVVDVILGLAPRPAPHRPLVIVVDDLPDNVQLLERTLRRDFDVLSFSDPHAALKATREHPVDVVISDQRMPGMTGTEFLSEIHVREHPIVKMIVSAYTDSPSLIAAINEANVDAFIVKPFKPQVLRDRIQELLAHRAALGSQNN